MSETGDNTGKLAIGAAVAVGLFFLIRAQSGGTGGIVTLPAEGGGGASEDTRLAAAANVIGGYLQYAGAEKAAENNLVLARLGVERDKYVADAEAGATRYAAEQAGKIASAQNALALEQIRSVERIAKTQARYEDKQKKRSGIFGLLGTVAGGIFGALAAGPGGAAAGASAGGSIFDGIF